MGDSWLVKKYCKARLKEIEESFWKPIHGSYGELSEKKMIKELQKILTFVDASPQEGDVISIWDEARPGYIRECSYAKWDGECWVKYVPAIAKPKTLAEIFSEIGKIDEN